MIPLKSLALDIGGTQTRYGLFQNGKLVKLVKTRTPKDFREIVKKVLFLGWDYEQIGVSIAGVVEKSGKVNAPENLGWTDLNIPRMLGKATGRKVFIANDADCSLLSVLGYGSKKDVVLGIVVGTGIGGSIAYKGKILKFPMEIGHISVDINGRKCRCGRRGCIEEYFSGVRVHNEAQARKGLRQFSEFLVDLVNIFYPDIIYISSVWSIFKKDTIKYLEDYVSNMNLTKRRIKIKMNPKKGLASLYGAYVLAVKGGRIYA